MPVDYATIQVSIDDARTLIKALEGSKRPLMTRINRITQSLIRIEKRSEEFHGNLCASSKVARFLLVSEREELSVEYNAYSNLQCELIRQYGVDSK